MPPSHEASTTAPLDAYRLGRRDLLPLVGAAGLAALGGPATAAAADNPDHDDDDGDRRPAPSRASNTGGITAFATDAATGKITSINDQPTMGAIPAHVIVDPSGKFASTPVPVSFAFGRMFS